MSKDRKVLLGLIGAGIQRSLTPLMHEEEARHHGLGMRSTLTTRRSPARSTATG